MELQLERSTIRPWRLEDLDSLVEQANDREIWRNLRDRFPHPYTPADGQWWIDFASSADPITSFAIVVDGKAVGSIGVMLSADVYARTAEMGYWLGRAYWGNGIATEAVRAFSREAFDRFDLDKLFANVYAWNPASARVLEKAGFVKEGHLRDHVYKDGRTTDELVYGLKRSDLDGTGDVDGSTSEADRNRNLVRRFLDEVYNKGNLDHADEVVAPDYTSHNGLGVEVLGPEGIKRAASAQRSAFLDLVSSCDEIIAEGNMVVVRGRDTGTFTGEFMGIAPTGRRFEITWIDIFRVENGMLKEAWLEIDVAEFKRQLGGG